MKEIWIGNEEGNMNYITPVDMTTNKLITVSSINIISTEQVVTKYKIIDILFINNNISWVKSLSDKSDLKRDLENDSYHINDIKNEQQVIKMIFERDVL